MGGLCYYIQDCEFDFTTTNKINILLNNLKAVDYQRNTNGKSEPQAATQIRRKPGLGCPHGPPVLTNYYPHGLELVTSFLGSEFSHP